MLSQHSRTPSHLFKVERREQLEAQALQKRADKEHTQQKARREVHTKKAAAAQKIENRIDELHAEVGGFLYMATVEGLSEKEEKKARATFQLAVI